MRHWTQEERERQAALIHTWKPWSRATGPVTQRGNRRVSKNALVHGAYGIESKTATKLISDFVRRCQKTLSEAEMAAHAARLAALGDKAIWQGYLAKAEAA